MRTGIYCIFDTKASMAIGGLHLHKHDATAVRFFNDVAALKDSMISRHPEDFQLIQLGSFEDDADNQLFGLDGNTRIVLEGHQWAAMQALTEENNAKP